MRKHVRLVASWIVALSLLNSSFTGAEIVNLPENDTSVQSSAEIAEDEYT